MEKNALFSDSERRTFESQFFLSGQRSGQNGRKVIVRAAVFNKLSKPLSWGFRERIDPGAFDGADMSDVVAVFNHNFDILLARTSSKTLKLYTDNAGLNGEFSVPDTNAGNDLLILIERGDIRKASFQFIVAKDRWIKDPDNGDIRIIEKFLKIIDISPVLFEAYQDTDVAKRRCDQFMKKNAPERELKDYEIPISVIHAEAEFQLLKLKNNH